MNQLGKQSSYRHLARLADLKPHNDNSKRMFGRDITNLQKKSKKNTSIYEKASIPKMEPKLRSRSLYGRKENMVLRAQQDAIHEYKQQIFDFMINLQKNEAKEEQGQISHKMRQILIDWLIDVHDSFQLKEQTLHLTLSYLSDYSSLREITKDEYQLVGITCLWIASKYQEIYPPRTKNYVEVTADTYSMKELKAMQGKIIQTLSFDLNRTTSLHLLQALKSDLPEKHVSFCKYMLELSLFQGLAKQYNPYTLVLAAASLADSIFKSKHQFKLQANSKIPTQQVRKCFKQMASMLENGNKYDLKAIKRKFARNKYHSVAKISLSLNL